MEPTDAGDGVVGVEPLANEIAGEYDAGAAQSSAAMDRRAEIARIGLQDGRHAVVELLLRGSFHVADRLVDQEQADLVHTAMQRRVFGERDQQVNPLAAKPLQFLH